MATVDVLIAGHVEKTDAGRSLDPSVSLVGDPDLADVVDHADGSAFGAGTVGTEVRGGSSA